MEKINNKYTFSKAAERMVELQKGIGWLDPNFELKDQSDLLIDEFEKEDKLVDIIVKAQQDYDKLIKEYAKVINSRDKLEQRVTVLTDKNKKLNEKCKRLKRKKNLKLSLDKSEKSDVTLSNTFISSLATSYEKSEKEKEREHEKVVESNKKVNKLTEENDLLHQKVAMREREIESLNEYIKSLESRL